MTQLTCPACGALTGWIESSESGITQTCRMCAHEWTWDLHSPQMTVSGPPDPAVQRALAAWHQTYTSRDNQWRAVVAAVLEPAEAEIAELKMQALSDQGQHEMALFEARVERDYHANRAAGLEAELIRERSKL